MPRNVEIKARVDRLARLHALVAPLAALPAEILDQRDVFFPVPYGRLKLRVLSPDRGELILYERPDRPGPKTSTYRIAPTGDPAALEAILTTIAPPLGTVQKRRWLYLVGQTRVHLDEVEGLGQFVELEVVLRKDQSEAEGIAIAQGLMDKLGIDDRQLIDRAYIDLMAPGPSPTT